MSNLPSHASPSFGAQTPTTPQPVDELSLKSNITSAPALHSRLDELRDETSSQISSIDTDRGDMTPAVPASLLSPSFTPPATPGGSINTAELLQQTQLAGARQGSTHTKPPRLLSRLPNVECIVRARIPTTTGAEMFLHLYHNDLDNKEHLAIVFGNTIRSRSLDKIRPGETEMDRMIRGAYVGKLRPGRVSSWYDEEKAEEAASPEAGGAVSSPHTLPRSSLKEAPLVRIHSECYTGETAWSARCDCGEQLDEAARLMSLPMETLAEAASPPDGAVPSNAAGGVIVYLRQEGRGIGLGEKLKAYNLQDLGSDTVEANLLLRHPADARSYGLATAILVDLGLGIDSNPHGIRLLTNNPDKIRAVEGPNREVVVKERVPMVPLAWRSGGKMGIKSSEVEGYLRTKEASPTPSGFTSADGDTPVADNGGSTAAAGRKRKLNSTSSRGVANLTPEQLAKKRANDRQAQRAIRERTKSHIESLEQRVRELSSQKPFLDLQAALKRNEAIQAENRDLKHGLKAVMDIIQPLVAKQDPNQPAPPPAPSQPLDPSFSPLRYTETHHFTSTGQRYESSYTTTTSGADTPTSTHSAPTMSAHRRDSSSNGLASFRIAFDYQRHNLAHGLDFGTDERLGFNFLLDASQQVPRVEGFRRSTESFRPCQADLPPVYTPSPCGPAPEQPLPAYKTPIRNIAPTCTLDAILLDFLQSRQRKAAEGVPTQKLVGPPYPSVSSLLNPEKSVYSHPLSKVFVDILRAFPDISSLPEQVAVLYSMFLLMRWQIYPTPENYERLPDWLTPRPSQLLTPHPAWIDYIPWPRMRDRLVASYQDYPFEHWFIPFTRTLSVNWPYEATDCLLSTSDHEDLIINPVFERHFRNLDNWSLGPSFAEAYPHMAETARIKS
ncbi:hypothetical protein KXV95_005405 [Aspergillus fumigatus]|nr:hypothetical protein KXX36_003671 [Aspergillus fumigatus]KAH1814370.1 hypothetical protein KXX35_004721 [Aspergillus fumigatus]KAH2752548.1 hypothetical protein KXW10_004393 [Aspergillus fumigatus]KAH3139620.1 hypothetical protein KXW80_002232 [Aspergillus fumigatus]KAH3279760.1 hypothetical protein KXW56_001978 [Aspergillus fumigatus]